MKRQLQKKKPLVLLITALLLLVTTAGNGTALAQDGIQESAGGEEGAGDTDLFDPDAGAKPLGGNDDDSDFTLDRDAAGTPEESPGSPAEEPATSHERSNDLRGFLLSVARTQLADSPLRSLVGDDASQLGLIFLLPQQKLAHFDGYLNLSYSYSSRTHPMPPLSVDDISLTKHDILVLGGLKAGLIGPLALFGEIGPALQFRRLLITGKTLDIASDDVSRLGIGASCGGGLQLTADAGPFKLQSRLRIFWGSGMNMQTEKLKNYKNEKLELNQSEWGIGVDIGSSF